MTVRVTISAALLAVASVLTLGCSEEAPTAQPVNGSAANDPNFTMDVTDQVVEASCGMCNFGLKADECSLAVKIDGKPYFVDGANLDDFGNAHDEKEGMCAVVRQAKVSGKVENGRFTATKFELLPLAAAESSAK